MGMKYLHAEIRNDGKLYMDNERMRHAVSEMPPGQYLLTLISLENNRTEREWQNWYRVIIKEMANDTGHSP
jgi:hypothetical protein